MLKKKKKNLTQPYAQQTFAYANPPYDQALNSLNKNVKRGLRRCSRESDPISKEVPKIDSNKPIRFFQQNYSIGSPFEIVS